MKRYSFYIVLWLISSLCPAQDYPVIRSIRINGAEQLGKKVIRESMMLKSSSWFKRKVLNEEPVRFSTDLYDDDVKRLTNLYQRSGYLNVSFGDPVIKTDRKGRILLSVTIKEGPPVRVSGINIEVDSTGSINDFLTRSGRERIGLLSQVKENSIFNDAAVYNDQNLIAEEFQNYGYAFASVMYLLQVDTTANSVKVNWEVNKGPLARFGSTVVTGNERVPATTILRQLAYKEGDIWSKKKIDLTRKLIYDQGIYRVAAIKAHLSDTIRDTIPLIIQISEAPRWTVRIGAGYGQEDKFRAFADFNYLGFLTNTARLNLYVKHSGLEPYNVYLKFLQPSVFLPFNTFSFYPYLKSENEPGYELKKFGINLSMQQNLSRQMNSFFGYEAEDISVDSTSSGTSQFSNLSEVYYKKSALLLGGIYNSSEPLTDPVQGSVISLTLKANGAFIFKDMPFYKILTEYKKYVGLSNGVTLAFRAKAGTIKRTDGISFIPVDERFYAGGSFSVRGWSRSDLGPKDEDGRPLGGNSLLEASVEMRMAAGKKILVSLFCDAGNVWLEPFSFNLNELHYAAGFGIRIKTPIGPTGIDFARPVFEKNNKWQINFNVGHSF